MTRPDICIHHAPCQDGFTSAWAVWKRWGYDVEYVAGVYGETPPDVAGKHVLIVDFSYKRPVLEGLAREAASITILDHHKTAEADLAAFVRPLGLIDPHLLASEAEFMGTLAYSHDPVFAQTVHAAQATLVEAKATLSGVTNAVKLIAGSPEGQCVTRLWALPTATLATALRVDFYVSPDGIAAKLIGSITVGAQTVSATVAITETQDTKWSSDEPLDLGPNQELWAGLSTAFAAGINVCAHHQKLTAVA